MNVTASEDAHVPSRCSLLACYFTKIHGVIYGYSC